VGLHQPVNVGWEGLPLDYWLAPFRILERLLRSVHEDEVFVLDQLVAGQVQLDRPNRIGFLGSGKENCLRDVPEAKEGDAADEGHSVPVLCVAGVVEGHFRALDRVGLLH